MATQVTEAAAIPATCASCGLSSTLAAAFTPHPRSPKKLVCPRCAPRLQVEEAAIDRKKRWITVGVVIVLVVLMENGWFAANLLFAVPIGALSMIAHELGHATAARALGLEVFKITLGIGPRVLERRLLGYRWDVRRYWSGGWVTVAAPGGRLVLLRYLLMIAAGPLTNALLAAAGCAVFYLTTYAEDPFDLPAPLSVLIGVNAVLGVANLVPYHPGRGRYTDGKMILAALLEPSRWRRMAQEAYYQLTFDELRHAQRGRNALAIAISGVERFPDSVPLLTNLGIAHLDSGRVDEARVAFDRALELSATETIRAIQQNNLAYALFIAGNEHEFPRGAALAANAYDAMPWEPAVASTHAAYLIWRGEPHKAGDAIRRVLDVEMPESDRKTILCTLAFAALKAGPPEAAEDLRREAERAPGESRFLRALSSAFAAARAGEPLPRFLAADFGDEPAPQRSGGMEASIVPAQR